MTQTTSTPLRKLAAIMFTDIAGFTKAMSADEKSTLALLRKKRSIIKPLISGNNGTFVKEIGDGTLSYFPSAIDAATCAVQLQQATYDDTDMNLRIGVHVGDIVFDDEDVFGDGVNVAARLESMAPVGGVCVSKSVFEELLNKKEFDGIPLGLQQLKGVGRLIDVFALKADKVRHPDAGEYQENLVKPHSDDEVPSVAVLPLKNKGKEEDAFYAYGITADLITDLSRAGRIRVASMDDIEVADAMNLSSGEAAKKLLVRYIVTGMLWKHEDMFQLSIEMNDTTSNSIVWSDRWQEAWDELTSIKGKLSENLLNALNLGSEGATEAIQPNTEAYEYYLKGKFKYDKRQNLEDTEIARGFFRKAIELDDTLLHANIGLGKSYYGIGDYKKALSFYEKALKRAEKLNDKQGVADSLRHIGTIHIMNGDDSQALDCQKRSLRIYEELGNKAGVGASYHCLGLVYSYRREKKKSSDYYNQALSIREELDDKLGLATSLTNIGVNFFNEGEFDTALDYYTRALEIKKEIGDKLGIGLSLLGIGGVYTAYKNLLKALEFETRALKLFMELGDKRWIGSTLIHIGNNHSNQGDYDKALDFHTRGLVVKKAVGEKLGIAFGLLITGWSCHDIGEYDKALEYFDQALDLIESVESNRWKKYLLDGVGITFYEKHNYRKAIEYLEKSLNMQKEVRSQRGDLPLRSTVYLFLSYEKINKKYDKSEIQRHIKGTENIEYDLNLRLYELTKDQLYIEDAYRQVQEKAEALDKQLREKFLSYPIPKAIVEAWEAIEK